MLDLLREDATRCYDHYAEMLNEDEDGAARDPSRQGLARELARMNLTLNTYTQWYWKTDLYNLFHFLSLRADAHAQYEIRAYAEAMLRTVAAWVPIACQAFRDYRLGRGRRCRRRCWRRCGGCWPARRWSRRQRPEPAGVGGADGGAGARELTGCIRESRIG